LKNSIFNFKLNFTKSKNSFLYDDNSKKKYLDFFGQYSTLTLGYNSDAFKSNNLKKEVLKIFPQKIVNCELDTYIQSNFKKKFKDNLGLNYYKNFHFCSTGALAVEAAIKTSITASKKKNKNILVFSGNFHGINSYGGIFSDRFGTVNYRLKDFPGSYIKHFDVIKELQESQLKNVVIKIQKKIESQKYSGVLVEPIQSTYGDRYIPTSILKALYSLCKKLNVPLIFDEIQTGFFTTGKKWYFQHIGIKPDIVIFGKKAQVSGIMVNKKFSEIFNHELKLNVTWNSDLLDMLRSYKIIEYVNKNKILKNIRTQSEDLLVFLNSFSELYSVRLCGYIIAFDLKTTKKRDLFFKILFSNEILVNPTGSKTIRMRPNLDTKLSEVSFFKKRFTKAINEFQSKR